MPTHYIRITPKAHVLVHHVTSYMRRTRVQLRPTSEQALESQHRFFDTLYNILKVNFTNYPVGQQRLLNAALHYNSLQTSCNSLMKDWADKYHVWGTPTRSPLRSNLR